MLLINSSNIKNLSMNLFLKYRRMTLIMGGVFFICSVACLLFPFYAGLALGNLTGAIFIACGIYMLISLGSVKRCTFVSTLSVFIFSLIYILLGYKIIINPVMGVNILSLLFCFLFIVGGLCRITAGIKDRNMAGRYWFIFIGLLDLAIAYIWLSASSHANFSITTMVIGLELLFCAWFSLITSFALKNVSGEFSRAQ
ncbi:DUF308 domain-containing protein [Enterobacter sp. 186315]